MTHQFLVTADLSSAEDVDFTMDNLRIPGVVSVKYLGYDRLEPFVSALAQVEQARESGNADRYLNALIYAINIASGLILGMHPR